MTNQELIKELQYRRNNCEVIIEIRLPDGEMSGFISDIRVGSADEIYVDDNKTTTITDHIIILFVDLKIGE